MNQITKDPLTFPLSEQWRRFKMKFASSFYELKENSDAYPEWMLFVMENQENIEIILTALDIVSNNGSERFPTLPLVKFHFYNLRGPLKKYIEALNCELCNNTQRVHNVEATIEGQVTLLDPELPVPCRAYETIAPCVCSGGEQAHADKRFKPPVEDGDTLHGCEHIAQRIFISECAKLLRGDK